MHCLAILPLGGPSLGQQTWACTAKGEPGEDSDEAEGYFPALGRNSQGVL